MLRDVGIFELHFIYNVRCHRQMYIVSVLFYMYICYHLLQKFSSVPAIDTTDMDPELARYLDRNYWQQRREENKQGMQQPSAPMAQVESATGAPASRATVEVAAVIPEVSITRNKCFTCCS